LIQVVAQNIARAADPEAAAGQATSDPVDAREAREDQAILQKFLPQFIDHLPAQVSQIESLLRERSLDDLARAVHQVKGTAGMYGFPEVSEIAARAEALARGADAQADLDVIAREVDRLVCLIRRIDGYDVAKEGQHARA
jgi:HPt (histidine-containing phosphotransfer) domain-containing protein